MISSTNRRGKGVPFKSTGKIQHKPKLPRSKTRLRINFPMLVFVLVFSYLLVSLSGEIERLNAMRHSVTELEQEIEQLQNRNAELYKMLEDIESEEYVEQVAREKLGLVKPGESLIVPVEQDGETSEAGDPGTKN
ncbi:cell division protein FtsB/cell division protein DivIC [Desulfohalotomaculum tongense]|uniref:FtsB family cell division protein n=1 Tax=Desulforadius tongensis TaxID=1216062 RepID=UPI0019594931|nr:septum formation initiator family protein [Desulforadius tongensis]MBM7855982.1 cell division protein FtsB/cell division protein DivIC [Desulforadius tongensis]